MASKPRDLRIGIEQIAKGKYLCRTRLGTRRRYLAVAHLAALSLCDYLRAADTLNAERTFFHHAAASHRHFGIKLQVERAGPLDIRPVKPPDFIRTVICAIACADAAIIYLRIKAFIVMHRGECRTTPTRTALHRSAGTWTVKTLAAFSHPACGTAPHAATTYCVPAVSARRRRPRHYFPHNRRRCTRRSRCTAINRLPLPSDAPYMHAADTHPAWTHNLPAAGKVNLSDSAFGCRTSERFVHCMISLWCCSCVA